MTVPTQPVTVNIADFGGPSADGVLVTALMEQVDYTAAGTFVSTEPVTGVTVAGQVVLQCFPNAVAPIGLGTVGSTTRFFANIPGSRPLNVRAAIPNHACNLTDILVENESVGMTPAELAVLQAESYAAAAAAGVDSWIADYTALRAYAGVAKNVFVTGYRVTAAPAGYTGWFVRDDSDTTSADNGGTIIVAANGKRWKRVFSGAVNVQWFGAVGDGIVDDAPAIQAAIDALYPVGGSLYAPATKARYRIGSRLTIKTAICFFGDGAHDNPGLVNGTAYAFPAYYRGTVFYVDSGVAGCILYDCTDVTIGTFLGGTNADKFKFEGARKGVMKDILWLNANMGAGADIGAHGIECRSVWHFENVQALGFQGDGFKIDATADAGTTAVYGNASLATLEKCKARQNSGNGFHMIGRDVSVVKLDSCDGSINGEWGFKDQGFLGNAYVNCHAATNNRKNTADPAGVAGSFFADSLVAAHTYIGCYVEGGGGAEAWLAQSCTVIGGLLAGNVRRTDGAFAMMAGLSYAQPYRFRNERGASPIGGGLGRNTADMTVLQFGVDAELVTNDYWKLKYANVTPGWYGLEGGNSPGLTVWQFPGGVAGSRVITSAFPSGLFLNAASGFGGTQILIDSGTAAPALAASSVRGDFRFNRGTTTDGIVGWRTMVGGAGGQTMPIVVAGNQSGPDTLTDADATLTVMASKVRQVLRAPMTANRTLTLSATNVYPGAEFKVTRTAASTGAFNLSVGGLKNLAVGQWCVVGYSGSAWELLEFGSL